MKRSLAILCVFVLATAGTGISLHASDTLTFRLPPSQAPLGPAVPADLAAAVRDVADSDPTHVLIGLVESVATPPGEFTIQEVIPPPAVVDPASVQGWNAPDAIPPTWDAGDTTFVAAPTALPATFVGGVLTITGSGVDAITYQLSMPVPPLSIIGTIALDGAPQPIQEVSEIQAYLNTLFSSPSLYDALDAKVATSTSNWASSVVVSTLPVITLENDSTLTFANAGDHETSGAAIGKKSNVKQNDKAAFLELGAWGGGWAEGSAWVGTAFYVRGCDPTLSTEQALGTVEIHDLDWEGCLFWAPICVFLPPPVFFACGAGQSSARITVEVRRWTVSGGSISGSGSVIYTNRPLDTTVSAVPFRCDHQQPPPSGTPLDLSTLEFSYQENHVYLVRALIQGRAAAVLGNGITDFQDESDGGNTTESGQRAGLFYNAVRANFNVMPMPDLAVSQSDLTFSPNPVISGWPVDVQLNVHNYGTADALNVHTEFLADVESMCKDPLPPGLADCPFIDVVEGCGGAEAVQFTWCSTGPGGRRGINAVVDPGFLITEKNETNNTATDSIDVLPPPLVASILDLDKSYSMETVIYPSGPRNIDVERWLANRWVDLNSGATALAVFNFGLNVVQALPMRYMDPVNKSAARAAIHTTSGVLRAATSLFTAITEGLDALCCMNATPLKALLVYTDGGDNTSGTPQQDVADIIAKALCCRVPIIIFAVPPTTYIASATDATTLLGGAQEQHVTLGRIGRETGGGYYNIPAHADSAMTVAIMDEAWAAVMAGAGEGVVVSPIGQPGFFTGLDQHLGGINVGVTGSGWPAPMDLVVTAPDSASFATLPSVATSGEVTLAGTPELLALGKWLRIPLNAYSSSGCTGHITIGDVDGLHLQLDPDFEGTSVRMGVLDPALLATTDGALPPNAQRAAAFSTAINTVVSVAHAQSPTTGGPVSEVAAPYVSRLLPSYPNPFNPYTRLRLQIQREGHVILRIFDLRGVLVRTLIDEQMAAGYREVQWDGTDDRGRGVSSGVYFAEMRIDGFRDWQRLILLK